MFLTKDNKVVPAQVKVSSSKSYTLAEIHDLANRYGDMSDSVEFNDPGLIARLVLSGFVEWLRKREGNRY